MRSHAPNGEQFCRVCGKKLEMMYPHHFEKYLTCGVHRYESDDGWARKRIEDNHKGFKKDEKMLSVLEKISQRFGLTVFSLKQLKSDDVCEVYGWNGLLGTVPC